MCMTAPPVLSPITAAQCSALKAPAGSCANRITCPRSDGSCGINTYGHRASDKGNTCGKACTKMGLSCYQGMEGTNNCACAHMDTVRQTFGCDDDLTTVAPKAHKAHYVSAITLCLVCHRLALHLTQRYCLQWCQCGKLPTPLIPVAAATCTALKAPAGSCANRITCPRSDGTCGINIYGHRGQDNGNTCEKACFRIGLQCVTGMEGTNNCACAHMNTVRQKFPCDSNLYTQKHIAHKAQ